MSANLFLSLLILPNNSLFPYSSNPISDSNTLLSHSLNPNPKFTTFSTQDKNDSVESTNPNYLTSKEPILNHGSGIRSRGTAPWMKEASTVRPNLLNPEGFALGSKQLGRMDMDPLLAELRTRRWRATEKERSQRWGLQGLRERGICIGLEETRDGFEDGFGGGSGKGKENTHLERG